MAKKHKLAPPSDMPVCPSCNKYVVAGGDGICLKCRMAGYKSSGSDDTDEHREESERE